MQHEILSSAPLLDKQGNIAEPGYAKSLLPIYNRKDIKAPSFRIKEWDYYFVGNDHFGLALTVADNSYMGLDSVTFFNFDDVYEITASFMSFLPFGKKKLPSSSLKGNIRVVKKNYILEFTHKDQQRILDFKVEHFSQGQPLVGRLILSNIPKESTVIATPFNKPKHFYFNQKINCMRAEGSVTIAGKAYQFKPDTSFAVLDWGRGVWTYKNTWYWGSASGVVDGMSFGFNIGYGFGNTKAATENMLIYNGKVHKLSEVTFHIPMKDGHEDYLKPWRFSSHDGRFEMDFVPILDRFSKTSLLILESDQHQVFGRFSGSAKLDDGKIIQIKDFMGFAEKVANKW
ncbi:MAG: hypothetical protein FD179_933 [Erysipelotrichaceae bacterium]|nr:MAG: hypothetical protein FD179_933 [Erysipelotrichaceae bacterium]